MQVIGIRKYDFEKDGKRYEGKKFFCTEEGDKQTEGLACDYFSLSNEKITEAVCVGDRIKPFYNKYGKVEAIEVI